MESMELLVYIVLAILAAGLIYAFMLRTEWRETSAAIDEVIQRREHQADFTLSEQEFVRRVHTYWERCNFGERNLSIAVYIPDSGNLTRDEVWRGVVKMNEDDALQQQDLNMPNLTIPRVVSISCINSTLTIR